MSVFHAEAAGDDAERMKTKALIQVSRMRVAGDDSVELQDAEAVRPALFETVGNQLFSDMQAARCALDRVAGVADMSAALGCRIYKPQMRPVCRSSATAV